MPVVTALKPTRAPGRYAVHIDGEYAFAVSEAFVASHGLYEGRTYDGDEYQGLRGAADDDAALAHAYRLVAHRQRSARELRDRLRRRGHTPERIEAVVARLRDDGLIDDAAFARAFVADKVNLSGWGRGRIARELRSHGVSDDAATTALAALNDESELERALAALGRQRPLEPPFDKARKRAVDTLLRRGFEPAVAHRAVARWLTPGESLD